MGKVVKEQHLGPATLQNFSPGKGNQIHNKLQGGKLAPCGSAGCFRGKWE